MIQIIQAGIEIRYWALTCSPIVPPIGFYFQQALLNCHISIIKINQDWIETLSWNWNISMIQIYKACIEMLALKLTHLNDSNPALKFLIEIATSQWFRSFKLELK